MSRGLLIEEIRYVCFFLGESWCARAKEPVRNQLWRAGGEGREKSSVCSGHIPVSVVTSVVTVVTSEVKKMQLSLDPTGLYNSQPSALLDPTGLY